jgi:glucokinase
MKYSIGIDIGGTKVLAVLMDEHHTLIEKAETVSDVRDRETMYKSVTNCIDSLLNKTSTSINNIDGFGVGVPGQVDVEEGKAVYQSNIPWKNFNIRKRLRATYDTEKVIVDNDVAMAGYRAFDMTGNSGETVTYITVSTGLACATIIDGECMKGHGFSGELGHVIVNWEGRRLRLEEIVSGTGIAANGQKIYKDDTLKTKDIFFKFQNKDRDAEKLIEQTAELFAEHIYSLIALIDPHQIVFGGSVMVKQPDYLQIVKEKLAPFMLDGHKHILDNMTIIEDEGHQGAMGASVRVFKK